MRNPKAEIRGPKEIRNPKSELGADVQLLCSDFWSWGDEKGQTLMVLREGAGTAAPPMPLQERTARFGEATIKFAKKIARNAVNNPLISLFGPPLALARIIVRLTTRSRVRSSSKRLAHAVRNPKKPCSSSE